MRKILESCPTCHGPLVMSEVRCQTCQTEVRSQYRPCDFCTLSDEQSTFVRLFVQNRGKLNAMEELLGISYPTVSAKLEEIIARLQAGAARRAAPVAPTPPRPPVPPTPPAPPAPPFAARTAAPVGAARREVLDRLSAGTISAAEALVLLRGQGGQEASTPSETVHVGAEEEA